MRGGGEGLMLFIIVWSALMFSGWVVVACSKKSDLGLAEISSYCVSG